MATQSLYRRYRPRRFSEVKGQDHVVRALRTAVAEGREGQAYLFSGPRGTGKTTSARILAKVLNCENPQDGEPCCDCESCLSVERGTSYDVHELDAASNNGVDAMRDLIEKASLGTPGRHKVYILDEVHMLSKAAEAALLKTLEEPPPHVVFVLATTDPQKMSDTIRSRTQHLQFHLLPPDTLHEHVTWVIGEAGLDVSEAAIDQVLASGAGSARDTLSALELVANAGGDAAETVPVDDLVEAMIERDAGRALTMVADVIGRGRDPRTLTEELIAHLRNGFLSLMAPELVQLPAPRLDEVADRARRLGPAGLVRGIEHLGVALTEMRQAPDPRVLLDVAVVQLTSDAASTDLDAVLVRIQTIESQLATGVVAASAAPAPEPAPVDPTTGRAALGGRARRRPSAEPSKVSASAASSVDEPAASGPPPADEHDHVAEVASEALSTTDEAPAPAGETQLSAEWWEEVRPQLKGMARAVFTPATFVSAAGDELTLALPNDVHRDKCEQQRTAVEATLTERAGRSVAIRLVVGPGGSEEAATGEPAPAGGAADADPSSAETSNVHEKTPAADADIDLDDLVDAPPETVKTPIDRLADAFPGSELVDDPS
jgi:DNA polymerase-3 subunit gamma/tau